MQEFLYSTRRPAFRLMLLGVIGLMTLALSPAARAADFTVATAAELADAIAAVNAAGTGDHSITLTSDITLTAPLPAFNNTGAATILLDGAGHTLDADGTGSALAVLAQTTVTVQDLTVTGGAGSSGLDGQSGGGLFNRGALTVIDSTITGNTASHGAGIFTYAGETGTAALVLTRVTISDNEATDTGGGMANSGDTGSITVSITDSTISGNSAVNYGGGISSNGHSGTVEMSLENSTVDGNNSIYGGGIFNNGNSGEATLTLSAVTLSNNSATNSGGGLYNNGNQGAAVATLTNSTLSGNTATKNGGGIANSSNSGTAELSLTFTTVAANNAKTGGSIFNSAGASTTAAASILAAGNQGIACVFTAGSALTSDGYNLDNDASCELAATGDVSGGDAALAPLAVNAPGETATHALNTTSAAQRKIPSGTLGCGTAVSTDQRGAARPMPAPLCDIGAYESDAAGSGPTPTSTSIPVGTPTATPSGTPPASPTPTVTTTPPATPVPGECNPPYAPATEAALLKAIACVNAAGDGTHTITLSADISLSAATTPLDNSAASELVIDGDGHILNGAQKGTVLTIAADTTARVKDITITGGMGTRGPSGTWGGGIFNSGDLTVENSTLSGNAAAYGGGIANRGDGVIAELTVTRSTISGNAATLEGGGIHNSAAAGGSASLNTVNATISGNNGGTGGGLFNEADGGNAGTNTVYTTFAGNAATTGGGGIHTVAAGGNSSVTMAATIITNGLGGSPDCARPSGTLVSTGYNLDGDDTCNLTQGSDLPAADIGLQPLALNAPGSTATHALGFGSPAIDRVHIGAAGCGSVITTDQRGAPRPMPAGAMCDSGSFEKQGVEIPAYVIYLPVGLDK